MNASQAIARMSTAASLAYSKPSIDDCESWREISASDSPEQSIKSKKSGLRLDLKQLHPRIKIKRGISFLSIASSVVLNHHDSEEPSEEDLLDPENRAWM